MGIWMIEAGVCFYSLHGLTVEVRWEGKGIEDEIDQFFSPFPFTKLSCLNDPVHMDLKFTTSDIPWAVPKQASEPICCYGLSIFEADNYVYVTDGLSVFQLQPQAGTGLLTLHSSFREKPLLSKCNFFLIGLIHLLSSFCLYDLHAAGFIRDGAGCLLLGESGSGKSSVALSMVRLGWHYTSDDAILLKSSADGVEALSFRKKFYLDPVLIHHYPEIAPYLEGPTNGKRGKRFLDLDLVYPDRFYPDFLPKVLIYTSIVSQPVSMLTPIDQTSSLIRLMKQSVSLFFNREAVKAHLDALKQLVNQTDSYELLAGRDLYEKPEKISEVLSGVEGI
jgi:energy-coupling factor transporter ATP-binding protein EcfA2